MESPKEQYYIGYLPKMPEAFRPYTRIFIIVALVLAILIPALLVSSQRGFSSGTYELGQLSTIEGILFQKPFPAVKLFHGTDASGKPITQTLLLMNFGKFGAEELVQGYEERIAQETGKSLQEVKVTLEGTLDYRNGKVIFELTKQEKALLNIDPDISDIPKLAIPMKVKNLGTVSIAGEIVDSKCYSGTMKPGEGKAHRACAVRCISGGLPAMLRAETAAGLRHRYLLKGPKGESINQALLPFVADPIEMRGKLVQYDDWSVLYTDPASDLLAFSVVPALEGMSACR